MITGCFFFFQAEDGIRDWSVTGVQTCALPISMIPTITVIGISFAILISGSVVVEQVFNIPGLGRLIISAVLRRDYPVIQGVVLCIAGLYMLVNLAVDLSYVVFDPRVRYQ